MPQETKGKKKKESHPIFQDVFWLTKQSQAGFSQILTTHTGPKEKWSAFVAQGKASSSRITLLSDARKTRKK